MAAPKIVDIAEARAQQRLGVYARRLSGVLADNKAVLSDLYASGTLFTRRGTRAGRELLLAHHHLLRMGDVLAKLQLQAKADGATDPAKVDQICGRLDALLERSAALTLDTQGRSAR